MSPKLSVVAGKGGPGADPEPTVSERIKRLQAEIDALGNEQVAAMRALIAEGIDAAREAAGNPSLAPGIRQIAEQVVRDGEALIQTLDAIRAKA